MAFTWSGDIFLTPRPVSSLHAVTMSVPENPFQGGQQDVCLDYARKNGFSGTDIVTACKELTGRGVRKISPDQVKAMLCLLYTSHVSRHTVDNILSKYESAIRTDNPEAVSYTHLVFTN